MRLRAVLVIVMLAAAAALPPAAQAGVSGFDHAVLARQRIVITGSNAVISGDVHSNGTVQIAGANARIDGRLEAAGRIEIAGGGTQFRDIASPAPPAAFPEVDLGLYRQAAGAVHRGPRVFSGIIPLSGIVFVDGDASVQGIVVGSGTIVATGSIAVRTPPILGGLAGTLNLIAGQHIIIDGSNAAINGAIYASQGTVAVRGNNVRLTGLVLGRDVAIEGSGTTVTYAARFAGILAGPASGLPPFAPVPSLPAPEIFFPQAGSTVGIQPGEPLEIKGRTAAHATVRVSIRIVATGALVEATGTAGAQGLFVVQINPDRLGTLPPGAQATLTISARDPSGRATFPAQLTVTIVRRGPAPGN